MNNNTDLINNIYNVEVGTYKAYFNGCDLCCLFSIPNPTLKYILNKDNSNLILERVKDLKHEIIKISDQYYCDYNIELISEIKRKGAINIKGRKFSNYKYKEIYIKINNEESFLIYKGNNISELKSFNSYIISRFLTYGKYFYIITPSGYGYYVNNKVEGILRKYFKYEDEKIVCMYNNKKEIAKLTLITENDMDCVGMLQSLELEINNKKFTFYINRYKYLGWADEGKYKLLVFHIHHNLKHTNQLLGYEPYRNIYYDLTYNIDMDETKFVLDNINQEIAKKFRDKEDIDFYTYIHRNNKNYGLIYIKDAHNDIISKKFIKITTIFEKILDISLLKPVDEWDNEEINAKKKYYEKEYKDNTENNPNKDNTEK